MSTSFRVGKSQLLQQLVFLLYIIRFLMSSSGKPGFFYGVGDDGNKGETY